MKKQGNLPVIIGILLILTGLSVLFDSLHIPQRLWVFPVVSVAILIIGLQLGNKAVRDTGAILLVFAAVNIAKIFFASVSQIMILYCFGFAISFMYLAILYKRNWLILLSVACFMLAIMQIIRSFAWSEQITIAYTMVLLATLLVVLFIIKNEQMGYIPLVLAILCYLISVPYFLESAGYIDYTLSKIIRSVLLIIAGIILVLKVYKSGKKEN